MTRLIIAAVIVSISGACLAQEKATLKLAPQAGVYTITNQSDMETKIVADGQQETSTMSRTNEVRMTVGQPDAAGNRQITFKYVRIRQTMKAGPREVTYDSAAQPDKTNLSLDAQFRPLLSATLTMTMDSSGKITKAGGLNEMWDKMAKDVPQMAAVYQGMKKTISDEAAAQNLAVDLAMLPDKPVAGGDTYSSKATMTLPFAGQVEVLVDGKVASLKQANGSTQATLNVKLGVDRDKPMTVEVEGNKGVINAMKMTQDGAVVYDSAVGMFVSRDAKQQMTLKITTEEPAIEASGKTTTKSTVTTIDSKGTLTSKTVRGAPATATKTTK